MRDLVEIAITLTRDRKRKDVGSQGRSRRRKAACSMRWSALPPAPRLDESVQKKAPRRRTQRQGDRDRGAVVQRNAAVRNSRHAGRASRRDFDQRRFWQAWRRTHQDPAGQSDSYEILINEESDKLLDTDQLTQEAIKAVEHNGIVFLDEIDKICAREGASAAMCREGVQREMLPLIKGATVATKHGSVKTDHILFIASGAFHISKPSDLLPELQGRLPIRVELSR